jgi:rod shape determining protein RodA
MHASPVKDFHEPRPRRMLRIDPLLLLASVGLIACSVYVIGTATEDDIAGDALYYVNRQIAYGVVGIALMLALSRFDYSRLREWKAGLYAITIAAILLVHAAGATTRGSKRAIDFGFFSFQACWP